MAITKIGNLSRLINLVIKLEAVFEPKNVLRYPRLDTVLMVEKTIYKSKGDKTVSQIWRSLPKKVMWGTFNVILKYLWDTNKIGVDKKGFVVYIWSPEAGRLFRDRKRY